MNDDLLYTSADILHTMHVQYAKNDHHLLREQAAEWEPVCPICHPEKQGDSDGGTDEE